jgi:hypothetical protein
MLFIMSLVSIFGKLVYMFSVSNEHILVAVLISVVFRRIKGKDIPVTGREGP